jgi:hypothetical protein
MANGLHVAMNGRSQTIALQESIFTNQMEQIAFSVAVGAWATIGMAVTLAAAVLW